MAIPRVAVIPFPGIDGAYICLSGKKRPQTMVGDRWYGKPEHAEGISKYADSDFRTEPCVTFLFNVGTVCAEWDGANGPIQITHQVPEGFTAPADSWGGEPQQHWFFPWAIWRGHWSQIAVTEERLPQRFNEGDFAGIFDVLRSWASRPNEYWDGTEGGPAKIVTGASKPAGYVSARPLFDFPPETASALTEAKEALSYAMRGTSDAEQSDKYAATIARIDDALGKAGA